MPEWTDADIDKLKKAVLTGSSDPAVKKVLIWCSTLLLIFYFWVGPALDVWNDYVRGETQTTVAPAPETPVVPPVSSSGSGG